MKPSEVRTRRRARASALQVLYQWEVGQAQLDRALDTFFTLQWSEPQAPSDDLRGFATDLVHETVRRLSEIDDLIAATAERWRPERMAIIDRLILRMSVCELLRDRQAPAAVVINEALELGRTFSTEDSVRFINGMLDAIRKKIEAQKAEEQ